MSDTPEEFNEFLFGPKNDADGREPTDDEEKRRLQRLRDRIEQAARESGLEITIKGDHPPGPTQTTERSKQIGAIARPMMENEDDQVQTSFRYSKIKSPHGWKYVDIQIRMGAFDDLAKAVKSIARAPDKAVELARVVAGSTVRMSVSVGKFIQAKAGVGGSDEEQDDSLL